MSGAAHGIALHTSACQNDDMHKATKAVLYIRVSTEEQAAEGVSLAAQEAALRAYCTMRGLTVVELVTDGGISAGKPLSTRPGGARVLTMAAKKQVHAVVAWKLDRLFRDAGDCLEVTREWDRSGVALHLVDLGGQAIDTASAMGRFFLTVLAGAAEMERNLVRERTSAALQHKAARGEFTGGLVRYGYGLADNGVDLVPVPAEQKVIDEVRKLRAAGLSLRMIAGELARRGFKSRAGRGFGAKQIRQMVRS